MEKFVNKQPAGCRSIDEIREQIDLLDQKVIEALGLRFQFVKEVVKYKKPDAASIKAEDRYNKVLAVRRQWAHESGLDPDIIEKVYRTLMDYFISQEMKIITNDKWRITNEMTLGILNMLVVLIKANN